MTTTLPPALHVTCGLAIRPIFLGEESAGDELRGLDVARSGGMSVLEKRGSVWCRTANGGGVFSERDLVGFDGIDATTGRVLFARLRGAKDEHGR